MLFELNRHWTRPALAGPLAAVMFVASSLFFVAHMEWKSTLASPPALGVDASDYDLIAWGLITGKGFVRDNRSAEFQAPYLKTGGPEAFPPILGPVTDRAPLYPLVLAATFRQGRQFVVIRLVQAMMMGLVTALIGLRIHRCAGVIPSLAFPVMFLLVDERARRLVPELLTETLACLLVTLLFLRLIAWEMRRGLIDAAWMGALLGLVILTRTMMVLWLPVLAWGIWRGGERPGRVRTLSHVAIMAAMTMAACLPWWVRNLRVIGEFRPFGTQGAEQLSAAYSDEAFARKGLWFHLDAAGFYQGIDEADPLKRTLARVHRSEESAYRWLRDYPFKAVSLWPMRVFQEFRARTTGDLLVLAFAGLGLALLWPLPEGRAASKLLASQVFAIAATWSVEGRFVLPLLGVLHFLAAVGGWGAYVALVEKRRVSSGWALQEPRDARSAVSGGLEGR